MEKNLTETDTKNGDGEKTKVSCLWVFLEYVSDKTIQVFQAF